MIERKEVEEKRLTVLTPAAIMCDVCGKDATGRRSPAARVPLISSRFELCRRSTPEDPVEDAGRRVWINETVVVAVADLCVDCAGRVANLIDELAAEAGRPDGGMRKVDEYGD